LLGNPSHAAAVDAVALKAEMTALDNFLTLGRDSDVDEQVRRLNDLVSRGSVDAELLASLLELKKSKTKTEYSVAYARIKKIPTGNDDEVDKLRYLGGYLFDVADRENILSRASRLAEHGDALSAALVSQMYLVGDGAPISISDSLKWSGRIPENSEYAEFKIVTPQVPSAVPMRRLKSREEFSVEKLQRLRNASVVLVQGIGFFSVSTKMFFGKESPVTLGGRDNVLIITPPMSVELGSGPTLFGNPWPDPPCSTYAISENLQAGSVVSVKMGYAQEKGFANPTYVCPKLFESDFDFAKDSVHGFRQYLVGFKSSDEILTWGQRSLSEVVNYEFKSIVVRLEERLRRSLKEARDKTFAELERIGREGDGSEDDLACKKKNSVSSPGYVGCRASLIETRKNKEQAELKRKELSRAIEEERRQKLLNAKESEERLEPLLSALEKAKVQCASLGFKVGTERFGKCVLQLSQ